MSSVTLTGRTRYRTKDRIFGKSLLILQVEEIFKGELDSNYDIVSPYTQWRDATVQDISTQEIVEGTK